MDERLKQLLQAGGQGDLPTDVKTLQELLCAALTLIVQLQQENQILKDEIARLKGEKENPSFKPKAANKPKPLGDPVKKPKKKQWNKSSKKEVQIPVHQEIRVPVEKIHCPECGELLCGKGVERVIVQDVRIELWNTAYDLEKKRCYHCHTTYQASLPEEIKGRQFGLEVSRWVPLLHYEMRLSQDQIHAFLTNLGMEISTGAIEEMLRAAGEKCVPLAEKILSHHLQPGVGVHLDETGWKRSGERRYVWVVSNDQFSYFSTSEKRNASEVQKLLQKGPWKTVVNEEGEEETFFEVFIHTDDFSGYSENKTRTMGRSLCWVHELRHFKKLIPWTTEQREEGERIQGELWDLYEKLKEYQESPSEQQAQMLEEEFDRVLTQPAQWKELSHRMELLYKKKENMLLVLEYPALELTNNQAERDLRPLVVRRKISGGSRSEEGEQHLTAVMSVLETARKVGVNILSFFRRLLLGENVSQELLPPPKPIPK